MRISEATVNAVSESFPEVEWTEFRYQTRCRVARDQLKNFLNYLQQAQNFDFLVDISCVDYLHYRGAKHRFGLVYLLSNGNTNERLTIRVMLEENHLTVPSVVDLWKGANWMEREVWDMFGIRFDGHPDLRRILLPEEFTAHPLRKDYPLQGKGERHNFPVITRGQA